MAFGELFDNVVDTVDRIVASFETLAQQNNKRGGNPGQQGVFGLHPLATPKYALNGRNGTPRDAEFKDTLARMYVSLADADPTTREAYLRSLPDQQTRELAKVLLGSGEGGGSGFIDFFLQQVQEGFQESMQVDKVLGDNYVAFYFGQEPPIFSYSGSLLNSQQDDQRTGFALAYQHLLRGTQMARRGTLLRLRYDSVIVSGTLNNVSQVINAENELVVPFNFTMLVKEYIVYQRTKFTKMSSAQYVQLATDFSSEKLSIVGQSDEARQRAVMIEPTDIDEDQVETVQAVTVATPPPPQALIEKAKSETLAAELSENKNNVAAAIAQAASDRKKNEELDATRREISGKI